METKDEQRTGYDQTWLDEGPAVFQWPYELSAESTLDLQCMLMWRLNAMRRRVGLPRVYLSPIAPPDDSMFNSLPKELTDVE